MDIQLKIKIDDFNSAMSEMQERLGSSIPKREIIDNEVRLILEKTLSNTGTATKASIAASIKSRKWITMEGKKYLLTNKYGASVWNKIQALEAASLSRKIAAISWARKSWYALASALGLQINSKGSEKSEVAGHRAEENIDFNRNEMDGNYVLMVENSSPLMRWTEGDQAFFGAIAGRTGFFKQNLAHGVFDDLSQVSRKYPGLKIEVPLPAD